MQELIGLIHWIACHQEFPAAGSGDYRASALKIKNADGFICCDLRYKNHEIKSGKYSIKGLPAVYAAENEGETLQIDLADAVSGVEVSLYYGVLPELDIITRTAKVANRGKEKVYVEGLQSACLDFIYGDYDIITFYGRHCMERIPQRERLTHGSKLIGSRRGTSSHQYNPFIILADAKANEEAGNCFAMMLMYSGGFQASVEKDQYNQTRALIGLQEELFSYPLKTGESISSPEAVLSFSHQGIEKLSHNLHGCIANHVCRGKYKNTRRPILINSWEAAYFDFNGQTIVDLAESYKELGIEMVVMDDGWFGRRNDDNSSLGDWCVNEEKLGGSLGELIEKVNDLGMKFGIWVEPEMISENSDLYKEHPDWALSIPGRNPVRSRNQLVLDFSRKEVVDYIYESICRILDLGNIEYLKWDMNRSINDVFTMKCKEQGVVLYDYVLGVYDFLERLVKRYPDLLIEGCSGGGGRFDAGMMYYTPQIWCSDNTDAVDRTVIQYGSSFGYPISTMGSHVSAVPNHQTGRSVPLKSRSIVAMSGTYGFELDPKKLTAEEKIEIKEQVCLFKKYADLIQKGTYYRLSNPLTEPVAAWCTVDKNKDEVLISAVQLEKHGNDIVHYLKIKGLSADTVYQDTQSGRKYYGAALMEAGIPLPVGNGDYDSWQLHFIKCNTEA